MLSAQIDYLNWGFANLASCWLADNVGGLLFLVARYMVQLDRLGMFRTDFLAASRVVLKCSK